MLLPKPDAAVADLLVSKHYELLKGIARKKRRRARVGQTLMTTDLLHEGWLKLRHQAEWASEQHFLRTAALAMRQVIIDSARRSHAQRRGNGSQHLSFDEVEPFLPEYGASPEQLVLVGDLMSRLYEMDERLCEVVDLRYFAGFTESEAAMTLGVSERTVRRDWKLAKSWLLTQLMDDRTKNAVD